MGRLLVLFFMLPWWAYIPMSAGVFWASERVYEKALETEAARASALETAMPEPVDLAVFDPARDIHVGDEVHVQGRIDHERDYELVEYTKGVPTTTRYLYMIFGANDPEGAREVRAALMLDKGEEERFVDTMANEWTVGLSDVGWVYDFNGFASRTATLDDMAEDAIAEQGLTMAEDFVYVAPFFDGREVALAPHGVPGRTRQIGWIAAAVVVLIGVAKRVMAVRAAAAGEARAAELAAPGEDDLAVAVASPDLSDAVAPDSPLGRLARRGAAPARGPEPAVATGALNPVTEGLGYGTLEARDAAMAHLSGKPVKARAEAADEIARPLFDSGLVETAPPAPTPEAESGDETAGAKRSDLGFYVWLGLAMLAVGALSYRPALIDMALPFAMVALFWAAVVVAFQMVRHRDRDGGMSRRHKRESKVVSVAVGAGGNRFDIASPTDSSHERGVI